ncbi:DNA-binding response regulator [Virgibacillus phasianinus]|uniref:DNA-binding response regulator n=1 Tax=Virgibacillus phasianinus TaxID=2017483 RepID=A0A220TYM3_9BACI|nr:response regulator transcription factor [Virgibacillus phasianinus]ASK60855.1 DNA-binding response regulator [Virgibacillus phasianinus]
MIRVVVVDDHDVVRKGIVSYLLTDDSIEVVGQASNGNDGAALVIKEKPDVVLMDLMMENGNGIDATRTITNSNVDTKIIILTSFYDDKQVFPAIEAGAFSYLLKTSSANEIVNAIKKAKQGENVIEPKVAGRMMSTFRSDSRKAHDELTGRELEVLICIGNGMTNQEISEKLYIGIKTVKTHVSNILGKLGVHDRTQAAVYVHRNNLISAEDQ